MKSLVVVGFRPAWKFQRGFLDCAVNVRSVQPWKLLKSFQEGLIRMTDIRMTDFILIMIVFSSVEIQ